MRALRTAALAWTHQEVEKTLGISRDALIDPLLILNLALNLDYEVKKRNREERRLLGTK